MNPTYRPLCALLLLPLLALAGCGEKDEPAGGPAGRDLQRFTVVLDYFPNADHAGFYAAQASGEFERAGLQVDIKAPPDPSAPLKLLAAKRADVVISYQPEVILARAKGAKIVSVAAIVQKPLTSLISLDDDVRTVKDLEGKRVGTAGIPYQAAYLETLLRRNGVDPDSVTKTNVGFNFSSAMLSGKVDATLGAFWNYEGTDLERRGRKPTIIRMEEVGVPSYQELVLVARAKDLDTEQASRLRRFLLAVARGHALLREDPDRGIDPLLEANPDLERGLQTAVVRRTLPVFFPEDESKPFGYQDQAEWAAYGVWMAENGLVDGDPGAAGALTNEFLPGEALDPEAAGLDGAPDPR